MWQSQVEGNAYGLAVANGHLLVSTDTGAIHAFSTQESSLAQQSSHQSSQQAGSTSPQTEVTSAEALAEAEQADRPAGAEARAKPISAEGSGRALGPFVRYSAPDTIQVSWETSQAVATRFEMAKLVKGKPNQPIQNHKRISIYIEQSWLKSYCAQRSVKTICGMAYLPCLKQSLINLEV